MKMEKSHYGSEFLPAIIESLFIAILKVYNTYFLLIVLSIIIVICELLHIMLCYFLLK